MVLAVIAASAALWLLALIRLDPFRAAKGTTRTVAKFFLLGMLSVVPTDLLYRVYPAELMLLGKPLWDDFVFNLCGVGPIEEAAKFLVFFLLARRFRSIREPADGMYQAAAVGLGFATVENFFYGLDFGAAIALARSFVTPLAHMTYASLWGLVYASRVWGIPRATRRDRAAVWAAVLPAAFVHGMSNFLANLGPVLLVFDALCTAAAVLVLKRLRAESPFAATDLSRPGEALRSIGASLLHDPANAYLHLRAAHFELRAGNLGRAVAHLDRYLAARPGDPYGVGLKGAARMLAGKRDEGERMLAGAEAAMNPRIRRLFRRNLQRLIAAGRGRRSGGFEESMLRTWLATSDLDRQRRDPRRKPPQRAPADGRSTAPPD